MLLSLSSLINKSWLKLFLPALMLMIALIVIGPAGQARHREHSRQPAASQLTDSRRASLMMPLPGLKPSSQQTPQSESQQPLFFLSSFVEASELSPEGMLALLGFTLLCAGALSLEQLKAHALARRHQTAFGPFTGPEHAPLFILLQVFRL